MILEFNIPVVPKSKQSARHFFNEQTIKVSVLQTKEIKAKQKLYAFYISSCMPKKFRPTKGPVIIHEVVYTFAAGKESPGIRLINEDGSYSKDAYKMTTPDLPDNLNKLLYDSMKGIVFEDDCQIIHINNHKKVWGDTPNIYIKLEVVENYVNVLLTGQHHTKKF